MAKKKIHEKEKKKHKLTPVIIIPLSVNLQFSSVTQSCLTLCDPMDCSTPGFPVLRDLLEFAQSNFY